MDGAAIDNPKIHLKFKKIALAKNVAVFSKVERKKGI